MADTKYGQHHCPVNNACRANKTFSISNQHHHHRQV
ncbi:Uncharacterised protein [Vibrio cholerae]|nr:Uncharacterised protein [Vibrio cholerae]